MQVRIVHNNADAIETNLGGCGDSEHDIAYRVRQYGALYNSPLSSC